MKIVCLLDHLGFGGAQRQLSTLAVLWKQSGYDVEFVIYSEFTFFEQPLLDNNIAIVKLYEPSIIKRVLKIRKYLRRGNQDVVVSFLDTPNFLACLSKIGGAKWKLIISERSCLESNFLGLRNKIMKWFCRYADHIVCNSHKAMNMWNSFYPKYADKQQVIYNTVNIAEPKSEYIPLKDGKMHLAVIANYRELKNTIGLIEAMIIMSKEELNNIYIDWYGNPNADNTSIVHYNKCLELIENNHLNPYIKLNTATSQIADRMYEADVIGLFSQCEGLPNAICEAMSLSKPIIMSEVSDFEVFITKNNGIMCKWDDISSIKNALVEMMNKDKTELLNLGKSSKQIADRFFNKEVIVKQWQLLFCKSDKEIYHN